VNPGLAVLLFVVAAAVDVLWVAYTLAVTKRHAVLAANAGVAIYLLGAVGTVTYVHRPLYLLPLVTGSWWGTFFSLKWVRRED